ncbi:anthranilate synthase component I family protein [Streptomyces sp. NBC_00654]|uniref:anthranilate synthase component I family protein n=1 Tax=Streptomyces sp. NBC_00654 TaxID=2975799 RepID=UPI0022549050|nr:anthranilate synthase component I family protein [Streptomyces sp. NBC_00654]MCX4970640.1 anthranilate synthase component I family protein [Streptomyces sp. NBC_00654]
MTPQAPAVSTVGVATRTRRLPPVDLLNAYRNLCARFGPDEAYLLESAAGPLRDRKYQFTGFGALLSLSVTGNAVRVEGRPALCRLLLERAGPLLTEAPGQGLRLRGTDDLWALLRAARGMFDARGSADRFRFGFLAYFGYDTARYVEELPYLIERNSAMPDIHLVLHQGCVMTDLTDGGTELLLHESEHWPPLDEEEIAALLVREPDAGSPYFDDADPPPATVTDDSDPERFRADVERCLEHIAVGDIYQVQIGHELTMRSEAAPLDVYRRLRQRNASPYMYMANVGGHCTIGASPELFVRIEGGKVVMRPIAGTLPRTGTDDEAAARTLAHDPKEIAEHTMLVDLCRNDIGRICRADTLDVPDQLVVERYSHVLHLVSTVEARVEEGEDSFDAIAALFPAGTMTGTPKIRAMEIIESVERSRRGLYAGALGLMDIGGYTNLALCIRTLFHHDGAYRTRASAGIVADSRPESEWRETLAKMSAAYWAVTGKELL